jgi:hypothetical protein
VADAAVEHVAVEPGLELGAVIDLNDLDPESLLGKTSSRNAIAVFWLSLS